MPHRQMLQLPLVLQRLHQQIAQPLAKPHRAQVQPAQPFVKAHQLHQSEHTLASNLGAHQVQSFDLLQIADASTQRHHTSLADRIAGHAQVLQPAGIVLHTECDRLPAHGTDAIALQLERLERACGVVHQKICQRFAGIIAQMAVAEVQCVERRLQQTTNEDFALPVVQTTVHNC